MQIVTRASGVRYQRLAFLAACTCVLAAIVHILTIFLVPYVARGSQAASRWHALAPFHTVLVDPKSQTDGTPRFLDPSVAMSVCPFRLSAQPVRIIMPLADQIISLSFHDLEGRVFYALNDRAGQKGSIELVLMNRQQLDEALRTDDEDEVPRDVRLMSPVDAGIVVVRVLALQPSEHAAAKERAQQLQCAPQAAND